MYWLIFGLYGLGTKEIQVFQGVTWNMVVTLTLVICTLLLYRLRLSEESSITLRFHLRGIDAVTSLCIFTFLSVISFIRLPRDLSVDENYFAWESNILAWGLLDFSFQYLPEDIYQVAAKNVIWLFSLLSFVGVLYFLWQTHKIKSDFIYTVIMLGTLLCLRFIMTILGGFESYNIPLFSLYLSSVTSVFSINSEVFRLAMILVFSIGITAIHRLMKERLNSNLKSTFILFFIVSIPQINQMITMVEVSNLAFIFTLYIVIRLVANSFIVDKQDIFIAAIGFYFRVSLIWLISWLVFNFAYQNRKNITRLAPTLFTLFCFLAPGISATIGTRITQISGESSNLSQDLLLKLAKWSEMIVASGNSFYLMTLLICLFGVVVTRKNSSVLLGSYFFIYVLGFIVSTNIIYAKETKYLIEYFYPILIGLIFSCIVIAKELENPREVITKALVAVLLTFHVLGFSLNRTLVERYRERFMTSQTSINLARDILPFTPYPYTEALNLVKRMGKSECMISGAVYSVFPEIFAGFTLAEVLQARDLRRDFFNEQNLRGEDWLSLSSESLRAAKIHCVLVSALMDQEVIVTKLVNSGWSIKGRLQDSSFGSEIVILMDDQD
jgi:hypothetical protein